MLTYLPLISGNLRANPGPMVMLANFPALEHMSIQNTPADEHCFIHSVRASLSNFIGIIFTHDDLINPIKKEIDGNFAICTSFFARPTSVFEAPLKHYLLYKRYNCDVDIIQLATASALSVCIIIVTGIPSTSVLFNTISPLRLNVVLDLPYIIVHLANDHCSATSCSITQDLTLCCALR